MVRGEEFWEDAIREDEQRKLAKISARESAKAAIKEENKAKRNTFVLKTFFTVVAIVVIVGLFFLTKNFYNSGVYSKEVKEGFATVKENTQGIFSLTDFFFHPENIQNTYSLTSKEGQVLDETSELTVKSFQSVRGDSGFYYEGDPIQMIATFEADTTSGNEGQVNVKCSLDGYNGEASASQDIVTVESTQPTNYQVACNFPDSLFLSADKVQDAKEAKIELTYDYQAGSYFRAYFITQEKKNELGKENYFKVYGIKDELLGANNVVTSVSDKGPVKFVIGSDTSQPFVEGTPFAFLKVSIEKEDDGEINTIDDLTISVPSPVELNTEDVGCNFEFRGADPDNLDYDVYGLKPSLATKYAVACEVGKTGDACRNDREKIGFGCGFRVREIPTGDSGYSTFVGELDYSYKVEETSFITIKKQVLA